MKRLLEMGYVHKCPTWDKVKDFLSGEEPVLSKIGLIIRERLGKRKIRMVVDSKESWVARVCRRWQKMELPTHLHAIWDMLELLEHAQPDDGMDLEHMLSDFKDAFFLVPNHRSERRFFVVLYRSEYYVFLKTAQGSRAAPLTWVRVAALITRLTMSVIGQQTCRMSTYVDDPLTSCYDTKAERRKKFAVILLLWGALRLPLSLQKAKINSDMTWTSATFKNLPGGVQVGIKEELLQDILQSTYKMMEHNLIRIKDVQSLDGKLVHVSSLVNTVRPFLTDLRAAMKAKASPTGFIWTKQILHVLAWIQALLGGAVGNLTRNYMVDSYFKRNEEIQINLDASPWGLEGYLLQGQSVISWFACPISAEEASVLGMEIGSSAGQQVAEALAALVALRAWHCHWKERQVTVRIRSDSVSALVLVLKLKTSGRGTSIIAREVALDIATACYQPMVVEHVPGLANKTCDALSRKYQPGVAFELPQILAQQDELVLTKRTAEFYRSLSRPPLVPKQAA